MYPKWLVNLPLACIWATFEYFTQFGPIGPLPYFFWFFESIILWSAAFWLVDTLETHFPPKTTPAPSNASPRRTVQLLASWVVSLYLWIPLLVIAYFLFKSTGPQKAAITILWYIKIIASTIVLFTLRQYMVKRYCITNRDKSIH
jgi:hypothetical protein